MEPTRTQADLSLFLSLTEEQRLEARQLARQLVIKRAGPRPTREQFRRAVIADYPGWVIAAAGVMLLIVFLASASISTFRLYAAGRDHFLQSIPIMWQAKWTGVSTALMAEFLVITAAASMSVFFSGRWRLLMIAPVIIGLAVAFTGNWQITQPHTLWGWLDTFAPPLGVLSVAIIGERIILLAIKQRWQNEQAYQAALAEWKQATAAPEQSADWLPVYRTALRDKLREVNFSGPGSTKRKEAWAMLSRAELSALVRRELEADNWYLETELPAPPHLAHWSGAPTVSEPAPGPLPLRPNGNGRH